MLTKKTKYILIIIIGALILGLLGGYFIFQKKTLNKEKKLPIKAELNIPETIIAGHNVCFDYDEWMDGCDLIIKNSWGVGIQKIKRKNSSFCVKDSLVLQSGSYEIIVSCNGNVAIKKHFEVTPNQPNEPLETYLGSKSITADGGEHWAMITAIPVDKYKNPVAQGSPLTFDLYRPNGENQIVNTTSAHLVAYHKIYSGSKTGKTIVGSLTGNAVGQEKALLEEPGYPTNFSISAKNVYEYADRRQFFKIQTSAITDKFNNKVTDGTLVSFQVIDPDQKKRLLNAYTIDGIATLNVLNPIIEGNLKIKGTIFGDVYSNESSIYFKKLIATLPVKYNAKDKKIVVGPLVGPLGQYVSDGSEIEILISPMQKETSAVIMSGYANINVKDLPKGIYQFDISFGGIKKEIKFRR